MQCEATLRSREDGGEGVAARGPMSGWHERRASDGTKVRSAGAFATVLPRSSDTQSGSERKPRVAEECGAKICICVWSGVSLPI